MRFTPWTTSVSSPSTAWWCRPATGPGRDLLLRKSSPPPSRTVGLEAAARAFPSSRVCSGRHSGPPQPGSCWPCWDSAARPGGLRLRFQEVCLHSLTSCTDWVLPLTELACKAPILPFPASHSFQARELGFSQVHRWLSLGRQKPDQNAEIRFPKNFFQISVKEAFLSPSLFFLLPFFPPFSLPSRLPFSFSL